MKRYSFLSIDKKLKTIFLIQKGLILSMIDYRRVVHNKITSGVISIAQFNGRAATNLENILEDVNEPNNAVKLQRFSLNLTHLLENNVNEGNLLSILEITENEINQVGVAFIDEQLTPNLKAALFSPNQRLNDAAAVLDTDLSDIEKIETILTVFSN